jgi:hypothetical protein
MRTRDSLANKLNNEKKNKNGYVERLRFEVGKLLVKDTIF